MPLVPVHKARQRRKIKQRPGWQDTRPSEEELRSAYDIAARHEQRWATAFMSATGGVLTRSVLRELRSALQANDLQRAYKAVPYIGPAFGARLRQAYIDVITEAGENEFKREKIPLTFVVTKAQVPIVPVNPWSLKWINKESAKLVKEVSTSVQMAIRQIILRGYKQGLRTDAIIAQIKARIGLLAREELAVDKRQQLMLDRGVPPARAQVAADRYSKQLLKKRAQRIARTEMVTAQSVGRRHAWAIARKHNELPETARREWVAVLISPRTCEICLGLDRQAVGLEENYYSAELGREVEGPGMDAHPQCRCVEVLRR